MLKEGRNYDVLRRHRYECHNFSAALKKSDTATVKIIKAVMDGKIVPLLHDDILDEYENVLCRDKFRLQPATIQKILRAFKIYGIEITPQKTDELFTDYDDKIFYEVALAKQADGAYLVTGNQRHYPVRDFVVTPAQMVAIMEGNR